MRLKFQRNLTQRLIRRSISDDSPESHQADLNRCTHPWELLKRPGRKTNEGHKGSCEFLYYRVSPRCVITKGRQVAETVWNIRFPPFCLKILCIENDW